MKRFRLINQAVRDNACYEIQACPDGMVVEIKLETRKLSQNAYFWALLTDVSKQVKWPIDGELRKITPEDWKSIFSASLKQTSRMAKGIDGGLVMLGCSTSKLSASEFSDLIELVKAFGAEHDVKFSAPDDNLIDFR